jgi:hypothetical protein
MTTVARPDPDVDGVQALAWALLRLAESLDRCTVALRHLCLLPLSGPDAAPPITASAAAIREFAARLVADREPSDSVEVALTDADLVERIRKNAAADGDYALAWLWVKLAEDVDRCTADLRPFDRSHAMMKLETVARQFGELAARHLAAVSPH